MNFCNTILADKTYIDAYLKYNFNLLFIKY